MTGKSKIAILAVLILVTPLLIAAVLWAGRNGPEVTSITPASGSFLGGAQVTVTGRNLKPGATLTIGGVDANGVVLNSRTIIGTTGPHDLGSVDVVIVDRKGRPATLADGFTYTDQDCKDGDAPALVAYASRIRKILEWRTAHDDLEEIVASAIRWERNLAQKRGVSPD